MVYMTNLGQVAHTISETFGVGSINRYM